MSIALGDECAAGCQAQIAVAAPAAAGFALPVPVPTATLFDLGQAQAVLPGAVALAVSGGAAAALNITIDAPAKIRPDAQTELRVQLLGADGEGVDSAELAVWVVDKALVDLLPGDGDGLRNVGAAFHRAAVDAETASSYDALTSDEQTQAALEANQWRLAHDPWATVSDWATRPGGALDQNNTQWFDQQVGSLTLGASGGGGGGYGPQPHPGPGPVPGPAPAPAGAQQKHNGVWEGGRTGGCRGAPRAACRAPPRRAALSRRAARGPRRWPRTRRVRP